MRRISQVAALLFLTVAAIAIVEARTLTYYDDIGPGPGFFPLWLAGIFGVLSIVWFFQVSLRPAESIPQDFVPDRRGIIRIMAILAALLVSILLVDRAGFSLTMFSFLLFLLIALGRQNLILTLAIALAGSFGVFYVFHDCLGVLLPTATIGFLEALGF